MKQIFKITIVGILFLLGSQVWSEETKTTKVLEELFQLHDKLVKEPTSKLNVQQLEKLLKQGGDSKQDSEIFKKAIPSLQKLDTANSLESKRNAYAELIETLTIVVKKNNKAGANVFYCPMVKKKWISKGETIVNPYDNDMRNCGEKI